jgi:hypothetical protein
VVAAGRLTALALVANSFAIRDMIDTAPPPDVGLAACAPPVWKVPKVAPPAMSTEAPMQA